MKNFLTTILLILIATISHGQTANMDFEEGNFNNWILEVGRRNSPTMVDWLPPGTGADLNEQIRIMGPAVPPLDEYGLLCDPDIEIPTAFPGGAFSARIGDNPGGRRAARISRTFTVTADEAFLLYSYAVILEEPGHSEEEQPKFLVNIKDSNGEIVTCGEFEVSAGTNAVSQGFTECLLQEPYRCDFPITECGANADDPPGSFPVQILPWTTGGADLTPFLGQQITVEFIALDCLLGAHGGTAYVEARVEPLEIQVEGLCMSGPNDIILTAPLGFDAYLWSTGETTRSINVSGASFGDVFTVNLTSNTGCDTSTTITLAPAEGATIDPIEDQEICLGGFVIISPTGTNAGDFSFPDLGTTGNSAVVSPTVTTTYTVIARDENGCEGESTTVTVTVIDNGGTSFPVAAFELENGITDVANPCNTIQLNNLSAYCKNDLEYLWDFGDGTTSTEENPLHTYPDTGTEETYTITLTATSASDGLSDTMTLTFTTSTIIPSFTIVEDCGEIIVTNTTTICGGNASEYQNFSYAFDFGDGSLVVVTDETQLELIHTYATSGDYTVSLVMTDDNSPFEASFEEVITASLGTTASFDFTIDCFDVQFNDTTTVCNPITSWAWDFGDGSPVNNEQSPAHTYVTVGPHTVTLTVDDGSSLSTFSADVTLNPDEIIPNFSFTSICDEVQFVDQSSSCLPLTYAWDFGDGSAVDQSMNPIHVFEYETPFTVTLTVNDGVQDYVTSQEVMIAHEFDYNIPTDMMICEDGETPIFNLLEQTDFILEDYDNPNFFPRLSYHLSRDDASNDINAVSTQFSSATNPQELFVRIPDSQDCIRIERFNVQSFSTPPQVVIENIFFCTTNNTEVYDLTQLNAQIFEQLSDANVTISFHSLQNEAEENRNEVSFLNLTAGESQQFFIRIANTANESCFSVSEVTIRVDNDDTDTEQRCLPLFSNTMTPNGDGANDVFFIENVAEFPNNKLTVYNRWGNIVYETNAYINNWEGTYEGKTLPFGTYYYTFEFGNETGRKHSGYVSLLR